jgi:YVTN family beta-propeller protein
MTCSYPSRRRRVLTFFSRLALPLMAMALGVSCGDTYRPVALPVAGQSPPPAPVGHMLVVSTNGTSPSNPVLGAGSVSRIDVSGDSVVFASAAGVAPGIAAVSSSGRMYVPNSGEDTVFASPALTAPQGTTIGLSPVCDATGTFCPAVDPVFATSTENTRMYVAGMGNGTVSVIDTNANQVVHTFPVDSNQPQPDVNSKPVALAELPNGTKIYSANQGTNSVSSINTLDGTINAVIGVGPSPIWAVANTDNLHVYVLDSDNTIWVIDTTTETAVSHVSAGSPGTNLNHLIYDRTFNRIYATDANSAQPKLSVFNVNGSTLLPHGTSGPALITAAPGSPCSSAPVPTSVTVLGDGTRAYVASYQTGNSMICTQVTVVDAASGTVTKTIPLSTTADNPAQTNCDTARFRVFAASSLGSANSLFKVYVSQCDAGTVAIIDTAAVTVGSNQHAADSLAGWLASPVSSFPGSQITITSAQTAGTSSIPATTFSYSLLSGSSQLQTGMTVYITGMSDVSNNGAFVVTAVDTTNSTFTVSNAGVSASNQTGTGSVIAPQNPVFLIASP